MLDALYLHNKITGLCDFYGPFQHDDSLSFHKNVAAVIHILFLMHSFSVSTNIRVYICVHVQRHTPSYNTAASLLLLSV